MRLVFMGSSKFALLALKVLVNSEHEILEVITQPDRAKGRGYKTGSTPVKELSLSCSLPLYQPENINAPGAIKHLSELAPEVIVVVAFGQILSREVLDIPPKGCINVHPSLLPKYRGAAPIHWAIINGEPESGVTTMFMAEEMDAGDIILQREVAIEPEDTLGSLEDKLAQSGAELLLETLRKIEYDTVVPVRQEHSQASYAPPLKTENCQIDWSQSAIRIRNLIRGTNPYPGAYTYYRNKLLKIWKAQISECRGEKKERAGEVIEINKPQGFCVTTGDCHLLVSEVQPAGKRKMSAWEFVVGYRLKVGEAIGQ